jgi:selenophosphate synthetase-related protein
VLTVAEDKASECIEILQGVEITSRVVGNIIKEKKLYLTEDNQKEIVFDFNRDEIMGIQEENPRGSFYAGKGKRRKN